MALKRLVLLLRGVKLNNHQAALAGVLQPQNRDLHLLGPEEAVVGGRGGGGDQTTCCRGSGVECSFSTPYTHVNNWDRAGAPMW